MDVTLEVAESPASQDLEPNRVVRGHKTAIGHNLRKTPEYTLVSPGDL